MAEPIFNVPRSVAWASGLMIAVHFVRKLLPDEMSLTVLLAFAFIPARYDGAAPELPGGYLTAVTSFVTYMIVHGSWVHLLVNVAWMLAFGSAVARRIGDRKFWYFSILCGVAGALTHLAFHFGALIPVVGASAAISGQMAAALRFIFSAGPRRGELAFDFERAPLWSLGRTLSDYRILFFLIFWVSLNVYFGLSSISFGGSEGSIAWEAHIGGFLCGLLTFGFFDRGRAEEPLPRLP